MAPYLIAEGFCPIGHRCANGIRYAEVVERSLYGGGDDVDDSAISIANHSRNNQLCKHLVDDKVILEGKFKRFQGGIEQRPGRRAAGVVDHNVDIPFGEQSRNLAVQILSV